ncbi:hypothetical protein ACLOJK_007537 [Asimina triloba]
MVKHQSQSDLVAGLRRPSLHGDWESPAFESLWKGMGVDTTIETGDKGDGKVYRTRLARLVARRDLASAGQATMEEDF